MSYFAQGASLSQDGLDYTSCFVRSVTYEKASVQT